jgi:hypothetical protein
MLHPSSDPSVIDMLRSLQLTNAEKDRNLNSYRHGYVVPAVPPANRYPRSAARAELESALQPWNRTRLGAGRSGYGPSA